MASFVRSGTVPSTTEGAVPFSAQATSPSRSASRPSATTATRCSRLVRDVARENATSSGRGPDSSSSRESAAVTWSRRAASVAPDSTQGSAVGRSSAVVEAPGAPGLSSAGVSGACSRMTCALVPLTPNDDTPARRGRPVSGHSRDSLSRSTAPADQSTRDDGVSAWRVFGTVP